MRIVGHEFISAKREALKANDKERILFLEKQGYTRQKKTKSGGVMMYLPSKLMVDVELQEDGARQRFDMHSEIKHVYGASTERLFKKHFDTFLSDYYSGKVRIVLSEGTIKIVHSKEKKKKEK
jgi:hypothetical protein